MNRWWTPWAGIFIRAQFGPFRALDALVRAVQAPVHLESPIHALFHRQACGDGRFCIFRPCFGNRLARSRRRGPGRRHGRRRRGLNRFRGRRRDGLRRDGGGRSLLRGGPYFGGRRLGPPDLASEKVASRDQKRDKQRRENEQIARNMYLLLLISAPPIRLPQRLNPEKNSLALITHVRVQFKYLGEAGKAGIHEARGEAALPWLNSMGIARKPVRADLK